MGTMGPKELLLATSSPFPMMLTPQHCVNKASMAIINLYLSSCKLSSMRFGIILGWLLFNQVHKCPAMVPSLSDLSIQWNVSNFNISACSEKMFGRSGDLLTNSQSTISRLRITSCRTFCVAVQAMNGVHEFVHMMVENHETYKGFILQC